MLEHSNEEDFPNHIGDTYLHILPCAMTPQVYKQGMEDHSMGRDYVCTTEQHNSCILQGTTCAGTCRVPMP